jgi:EmrB/QacA subfamily drug resistance transporter
MRKWWPLVAICTGAFMLLIDVTIVNVALPDMARQLHTTFPDLQWVIDLYALVLGALVLTVGSIADRFGRKKVFLAGLVLFAVSSLACGVAPNVSLLIAARGVQGLGGATMFATTMALISHTYTGRDRGVAFGVWGAINGAAAAVGPIAGGLLTANFGWRWIFLVNLPICVVAVTLTLKIVPESRDPHAKRIDLAGMVTFTAAAGALTYALIRGAWASPTTIALLVVSVLAIAGFIIAERRSASPMLDLSLLKNGTFTGLLIAGALLSAAAWAGLTYESLWLQSVLGCSAIEAGLIIVPCALSALVASALIGKHMHRMQPRVPVGVGLLIIAVGALAQAVIRTGSGWAVVIPGLVLVGIGAGLAMAPLSATTMSAVPWQRAGMAGGALSAFRQLGYAFGIAVLGEVFRGGLTRVAGSALAAPLGGGEAGSIITATPQLKPLVHHAFATGLDTMFLAAAGFGVIAAIAVFALVRPATANGAAPPEAPSADNTAPAPTAAEIGA